MDNVLELLISKPHKTYYWSDSIIVLSWISQQSRNFKTLVANRISRIKEITDHENWYHINTTDNPADVISRGQQAAELINNKLWWHGPEFVTQPYSLWLYRAQGFKYEPTITNELKELKTKTFTATTWDISDLISRFSTFNRSPHIASDS